MPAMFFVSTLDSREKSINNLPIQATADPKYPDNGWTESSSAKSTDVTALSSTITRLLGTFLDSPPYKKVPTTVIAPYGGQPLDPIWFALLDEWVRK
ncbi:hypothetical protein CDAR_399611 [Caerostris darwini]|uniref:Uncharacterized protein n=1 Tax=Caerostris darwini TaxID=1538125 RepID=A0AAV4RIX2_9ARAC|nr:hypothetical protein CDAR_399611 [Caerostris darwini]